jgi:hypothetical protein
LHDHVILRWDSCLAMRQPLSFDGAHGFLDTLFGDDLHAKRVKSLAGATLGVIQSASLAVGMIGQSLPSRKRGVWRWREGG